VVFASTLFTRAVDPVVPKIAHDLGIDVKTAALLSTAFTFPYAFTQPVLGTIGDFFGKTRLMNISLIVVVTTTLVCAFAESFSLLVAMRILAGILAGAIGRLLAVALTGNLIGAVAAGVIGDILGWRGVFFSIGVFGLVVAVIAFFAFRGLPTAKPRPFNLAAVAAGFRSVFADPRAKICFGSVFFEGIVIHGLFPYVALLLLAAGLTQSSYAGLVIGGFGLGGILYAMAVPLVILRVSERQLILSGASLAGIAFILIALNLAWYWQAAIFVAFGIGFYMLHTCIQLHATELTQTARGTALSMHSCAFFSGQALGPIYYGFAFSHFGLSEPLLIGSAVILAVGLVCARYLRHRRRDLVAGEGA
jgi:predicted MFS family arabinose efflux permease